MEELIELLNEYKKIKWYDWNTKIINYDTDTGSFTNGYSWLEYEIVIWKRYGFIKWLVENDKIDESKLIQKWLKYILVYEWQHWTPTNKGMQYLQLLMLLSIQDEPIEFLIEIIK